MPVILIPHRNIEVDDLGAAARPQQVVRLDVAVIDALAVEVDETLCHLPEEHEGIFWCEARVEDEVADILALYVLEEHIRRTIPWYYIGVNDAHDMRMLRQVHERLVLFLEAFQG